LLDLRNLACNMHIQDQGNFAPTADD